MPIKHNQAKPVPASAVRVWRGFKDPQLATPKFFQDLGQIFVPATVELQWQQGLDAYIPSFPAGKNKPATVPDETAVLFWDSQLAYKNGFNTLAIRTYSLTHNGVYNTQNKISTADFPGPYADSLVADQSYFFFNKAIDWMQGTVFHLVGGRPAKQKPAQFISALNKWAQDFYTNNPDKAAGAIICASNNYVLFWECIPKAKKAGKGMAALAKLCEVYHNKAAKPQSLAGGLFDNWMGLNVKPGDSYNMQFSRRDITD